MINRSGRGAGAPPNTPAASVDHRVAAAPYHRDLTAALNAELRERYGDEGETPADPSQFVPPYGLFVVARLGGQDVGCGGWRTLEPGVGEIKRMYVVPEARGQGLARAVLRALVADARDRGITRLVLETGAGQPEAIGLYVSEGFTPAEPYGEWVDDPAGSLFFGLRLSSLRASTRP